MMTRLKEVADGLGLAWGRREKTYNIRLAQELGKWAESQGKGEKFHDAVYRAYFVHGRNIGKTSELVELARALDLPGEEARKVLETRACAKAVDLDWSRAHKMNVTAVPTFVINEQALVGAHPYETLEDFVKGNIETGRILDS
jgi:predicted DsbA family dithiol-disulfide isomerase